MDTPAAWTSPRRRVSGGPGLRLHREPGDISCIISRSSKRLCCDLVLDMPSCLFPEINGSTFTEALFIWFLPLATCFPPSLSSPLHLRSLSGSRGGSSWADLGIFAPPSLQATGQMPPLHSFLTTRSRGSVFCCSWTALPKSLSFTLSVCAARLTKTPTAFFQAQVLVLASPAALCPPPPPPPLLHPASSLQHQIFHFHGGVLGLRR